MFFVSPTVPAISSVNSGLKLVKNNMHNQMLLKADDILNMSFCPPDSKKGILNNFNEVLYFFILWNVITEESIGGSTQLHFHTCIMRTDMGSYLIGVWLIPRWATRRCFITSTTAPVTCLSFSSSRVIFMYISTRIVCVNLSLGHEPVVSVQQKLMCNCICKITYITWWWYES